MSGSSPVGQGTGVNALDLTRVVIALQELTKASYLTQQTLLNGISVNTQLPITTVAGLPAVAPLGQLRFASNGRNPGEGAAAGTGTLVIGTGAGWRAVWSGVAVTV